ncbi:MAG TPA: FecR family protein [Methyloceanibacter sp.]|jgi:hypothetical protein|nr:FecR family protein [Methyloceanibacter sp.]
MQLRIFVLRLVACAAVLISGGHLCAAEPQDPGEVGLVNKVENGAQVISVAGATTALIGTPVHMRDELRTGAGARLQVTFRDNTVLTLGEHASVVVDRYVYEPERGAGETVLQATKGAFRFVTGKIKELKDKEIAVSTPVADIGVRGTEFWGGPINAKYGVLLLEGEVVVSNQAGSVTLSRPGQGTDVPSPLDAPEAPSAWPAEKVARAVDSVALH